MVLVLTWASKKNSEKNMKKIILKPLTLVALLVSVTFSCKDSYLAQPPTGNLATTQILNQPGIENLLIGAYAGLKGNNSWLAQPTNWVYGSVVGEESYKGSNSGDQSDINPLTTFTATATNSYLFAKWIAVYDGINRSNTVLKMLAQVPSGVISTDDVDRITGEAIFLRAFFHLEGYKVFRNIPYVDETIDYAKGNYNIANSEDVMPKIIADFDAAASKLPETMSAPGRANKWAALAFKAKCLLYQGNYAQALPILTSVITSGKTAGGSKYALQAKFRNAFDASTDNNPESVFAIQASVNDGSGAANANADLVLNYPYGGNSVVTCCGFNQPSMDLANSYRVGANGLPLLDGSYNTGANQLTDIAWQAPTTPTSVPTDNGLLDPRIDWTIGRTGVPFLDWGTYTGIAWVRSASDGGPYTPKKYDALAQDVGKYTDGSSWTPGYNAVNQYLMRYADVLLMAAECEVEAGSLANAMGYVNQIRARVQDPASWVKLSSVKTKTDWQAYTDASVPSTNAGNYMVSLYGAVDGTFAAKASARKAVHFERKLELALEGHRFFDLVRWGETTKTNTNGNPDNLEANYMYNLTLAGASILGNAFPFVAGKSEIFPIPQTQIDLSGGTLKQNPNY
jgi:hypothetical protein